MVRRKRREAKLASLPLAALLLTGCAEGSGSTSVTLSGTITESVPDSQIQGQPIADVEVCEFGSRNCALTDQNGEYSLRVLKNRELEMSHVRSGFGPVLVARRSGIVDFVGDAGLATDAALLDFYESLGTPYPPVASGFVTATAYQGAIADDTRIEGVSYSLMGSDGRSFYLDDAGTPDTSLTETQASGSGGFVDVAPRTVDLQVTGAANCSSESSWLSNGTNTFKLPVRIGFRTQSEVSCE